MGRLLCILSSVLALGAPSVVTAGVIHVPSDQPTIQAGVTAASLGDTVVVACGHYAEHDIVMKSGICLTSETGLAHCVVIDGQAAGRVFYCKDVDSSTRIIGLSVTNGLSVDTGSFPDGYGGGMHCDNSSPDITRVIFDGNVAGVQGGGLLCVNDSSPILTDCVFRGNTALAYHGGGIYCYEFSDPVLTGVTFISNTAELNGGGMASYNSWDGSLTGCDFFGNVATKGGGLAFGESGMRIDACSFSANVASAEGGAVANGWSSCSYANCTFTGNSAQFGGAAHEYWSMTPSGFTSCTFSGNSGDAVYLSECYSVTIANCVLAFTCGGRGLLCDELSNSTVSHCCVFGNAGGDSLCGEHHDNMFIDPGLCDPPVADVALCSDSVCLPGGNPWGELVGSHGVGCGPCGSSVVMQSSWGLVKALYR